VLQTGLNNGSDFLGTLLNFEEQVLAWILGRQHQDVAIVGFDPLRRQPPKLAPQSGDVPVANIFGQTQVLESQDQVVRPQNHLHVSSMGPETAGRNLGHRIGALELAQQKFLQSPVAVKTPNRRWAQLQVGDQRLVVGVLLEGKKSLLNRFGFQSRSSAHGHKPMVLLPTKRHKGT